MIGTELDTLAQIRKGCDEFIASYDLNFRRIQIISAVFPFLTAVCSFFGVIGGEMIKNIAFGLVGLAGAALGSIRIYYDRSDLVSKWTVYCEVADAVAKEIADAEAQMLKLGCQANRDGEARKLKAKLIGVIALQENRLRGTMRARRLDLPPGTPNSSERE